MAFVPLPAGPPLARAERVSPLALAPAHIPKCCQWSAAVGYAAAWSRVLHPAAGHAVACSVEGACRAGFWPQQSSRLFSARNSSRRYLRAPAPRRPLQPQHGGPESMYLRTPRTAGDDEHTARAPPSLITFAEDVGGTESLDESSAETRLCDCTEAGVLLAPRPVAEFVPGDAVSPMGLQNGGLCACPEPAVPRRIKHPPTPVDARLLEARRALQEHRDRFRRTRVRALREDPKYIHLQPSKLKVTFLSGIQRRGRLGTTEMPARRYTLTHSDITADLFLSIGVAYNRAQLRDFGTQLMRDEVLAEWCLEDPDGRAAGEASLRVHVQVTGGLPCLVPGTLPLRLRYTIFKRHLPQVFEAIRQGDTAFLDDSPLLRDAPIWVHFHSETDEFDRVRYYGTLDDYALSA